MSTAKKLAAVVAAAGAIAATPASAIVVGGIDFGALGFFAHIETATIGQTFVNGVGQNETAYGLISTVNGDSTYCADGTANCSLYYVLNSTVSAAPDATTLYLNGTQVSVFYSGAAAIDLFSQGSAANIAFIQGLTTWATFNGENGIDPTAAGLISDARAVQTLTGASISVTGSGLLSVDTADGLGLAAVEAFMDANTIPTFTGAFADIAYTISSNNFVLNPFDEAGPAADSCATGAPQVGDFCLQGSADLRGRTVLLPEPAPIALLGLGMLAMGVSRRAKRTK